MKEKENNFYEFRLVFDLKLSICHIFKIHQSQKGVSLVLYSQTHTSYLLILFLILRINDKRTHYSLFICSGSLQLYTQLLNKINTLFLAFNSIE